METTIIYLGYMGIMENKMETTIVYWGYMGIMKSGLGFNPKALNPKP